MSRPLSNRMRYRFEMAGCVFRMHDDMEIGYSRDGGYIAPTAYGGDHYRWLARFGIFDPQSAPVSPAACASATRGRSDGAPEPCCCARYVLSYDMPSKNPDVLRATQQRYRARNKERILARRRAAYAANVEVGRAKTRAYREAHPNKVLEYNARWRRKFFGALRREMVTAYGGACACCGESEIVFLDLDHIHNDGKADRDERGNGQRLLVWLKANGWPKDRYQLLCCNCNQGKVRNGGKCPHVNVQS